ncbi:MAG: bifunctional oligoribonuclease/PAP phosphatase NrnA [Bacteroidales bacterium]|nr:bifunctional oligoribonuclease/PAP phosphatase NrnA [Bacteroidales bacterium]
MDKIKELDSLVGSSGRVCVTAHIHPDGDALGSGLALVGYLRECRGKDAALVVPDAVPESLRFILRDFREGSVLSYDEAPDMAKARIGDSDLIFCLDFPSFSRTNPEMESLMAASEAPKVLIDHHLNPDSGSFSLVFSETEVSSTCELLYLILKEMPDIGGDLDRLPKSALEALMTGMTTDTNNFANSVYPGTMRMASELIAAGVDRDRILSDLYHSYRENRLRLMGYLLSEKMVISPEGAAVMILDKECQKRFGFRQGESEGFVNMPLSVSDIKISLFLTEEDGKFRVSVRSKQGVSANELAMRYFHGGGHERAAGGKLFFPGDIPSPEDAEAHILKVTREFLAL